MVVGDFLLGKNQRKSRYDFVALHLSQSFLWHSQALRKIRGIQTWENVNQTEQTKPTNYGAFSKQ